MTIAMITHEVPGDSFWDLIRKGAEAAAKKDNIELRYSNDPEAPNQANLVQSAVDSGVDGIAVTLAKPDAMTAPRSRPPRPRASRSWRSTRASTIGRPWGCKEYFGQDEYIAGQAAGKRLNDGRRHEGDLRDPGAGPRRPRSALRRSEGDASRPTEMLNVNGKDMPSVESTITAKLQQDPAIDYVVTLGAPFALTAVQSAKNAGSTAKVGTFDTNAALVDAIKGGTVQWAIDQQPYLQGYLADRLAVALRQQQEPDRRRPADADRAVLHRQVQHRRRGRTGQGRNSIATRGEYKMTTQADLDVAAHKVVRDERVKERNRLQRILIRPEMGAAIGAIGDLRLLPDRGAPVPRSRRRSPPCCTPARPSASWPAVSRC